MTGKELREARAMGLVYVDSNAPMKWTGRRRLETPERPAPLPEGVPIYEHDFEEIPESIRVSFENGSTAVYDLRREQPHPLTVKCVETIRKWNNGYNNQPMRRRRKP